MKKELFDKGFNQFDKYIDEQTGFLHINGVVARTGIQDYLGLELGDTENPTAPIGVYRPKEEVLKQESLDTYINSIVTDNHPNEFVTTDNIKDLGKGSTSSIEVFEKDGIDYIKAKMTITDKNLINKIMNGKVEISAGYSQDLIKEKGEFQGKAYDYKQTNIKINHVAIVDKGRCGDKCKVTTDKKDIINTKTKKQGDLMASIVIDGVTHEVTDCVGKFISDLNSKVTALDADFIKEKSEKEKVKGENEKLKEDMEEEKKKTSDTLVDSLVNEKVALLDTAKTLNVTVDSKLSAMDIKKAVIASSSKISLDGKSTEFIDGVYETVIAGTIGKKQEIKDSQKKAFDGFETKTKDSSFANMAKEEL